MIPSAIQTDFLADQTRRAFLGRAAGGFGTLALGCLLREQALAQPMRPHFAPRARRVISLFMSGGPSHVVEERNDCAIDTSCFILDMG